MMNNTRRIASLIGAMVLAAASAAGYASFESHRLHPYLGLAVLALAAATSRMKVKLPGINGNMSVNLPFLLTAIINLSAAEAVLVTCVSTTVQCWPRKNARFNAQQMTFNLSMMAFASSVATMLAHAGWLAGNTAALPALPGLILASLALFLGQTIPVAGIVAVSEHKQASRLWWELAHLSFPYYAVSAGMTSMLQSVGGHLGWGLALAVFPVMYMLHRCYRLYFSRMVESMRTDVLVRAAGAGA
ncbi:MAG TPA: hypothetical protein VFA67_04065 [Candidatus Sulfotelmatobacter sp.]|nr:hypothetical protein [Candidatus Sulfotelmatobacter sp.]